METISSSPVLHSQYSFSGLDAKMSQMDDLLVKDILIRSLVNYTKTLEDGYAELEHDSTSVFSQPSRRADHKGIWIDGVKSVIETTDQGSETLFVITESDFPVAGPVASGYNLIETIVTYQKAIEAQYGS
jgi:hypothetical protein